MSKGFQLLAYGLEDASLEGLRAQLEGVVRREEVLQNKVDGLQKQLIDLRLEKGKFENDIKHAFKDAQRDQLTLQRGSGPDWLRCVDTRSYAVGCSLLLILSVAVLVARKQFPDHAVFLHIADNIFLWWYSVAFLASLAYFQKRLFLGKFHAVVWNWLDLGIVFSAMLEHWVIPFLPLFGQSRASAISVLRALRVLRVLRILRLYHDFLISDLRWLESAAFKLFMSAVIGLNCITMAAELDIEWSGWHWLENAFLLIYFLELSARLMEQGRMAMRSPNLMWNVLDTVVVLGGVADLWLIPAYQVILDLALQEIVDGTDRAEEGEGSIALRLLKLMRIIRILRLVRLVRTVKPLYRLLLGVLESLKAMQWVLVLTGLMLYSFSLFWRTLVGKGLLGREASHGPSQVYFGSVAKSLFSLFRLMNGDLEVCLSITDTVFGQLLIVAFVVVANWAILAILTAVVSDNMIVASKKSADEDIHKEKEKAHHKRVNRLKNVFAEYDRDSDGCLNEKEWTYLLTEPHYAEEIGDATALASQELMDMFHCLAVPCKKDPNVKILYFDTFFDHLMDETEPANKRCVVQVLARLQDVDRRVETNLGEMQKREIQFEEKVMNLLEAMKQPAPPEKQPAATKRGAFERPLAATERNVQALQGLTLELAPPS